MSDKFLKYWKSRTSDQKHALAGKLGVTYQYCSMIANGHRKAGLTVLTKISKHTGGKVTMKDLRPDIYG